MVDKMFSTESLASFLVRQENRIRQAIQSGDLDDDIRENPESVVRTLCDKYTLERVHISREKMEPKRTTQGDMMTVSFYIMFKGDQRLLEYYPSTRGASVPGSVREDRIVMEITGQPGKDDFKSLLGRWWDSLDFHLESANKDADDFNHALPHKIKPIIEARAKYIHMADAEMKSMGFT